MAQRPRPIPPGPGQESVWDYPRPPALRASTVEITVLLGGVTICRTDHSYMVLETSHPPTYYLPMADFLPGALEPAPGGSVCEWKGVASYLDVIGGDVLTGGQTRVTAPRAGWFYPEPAARYSALADHVALYPGLMERCTVAGETVQPQPGGFYGGWVTSAVSGPFKGGPGSMYW